MRVRFLGTGDAFNSGGRLHTCILLEGAGAPCLLDCGATALAALKGAGVDRHAITAVLVTHLHGDHFGGLPFLLLDGQFTGRSLPLMIAGPPGLETRLATAYDAFYPGVSRTRRPFDTRFTTLTAGVTASIGELQVTPFAVVHPSGAPAYALRVEMDGRVIVFSGDTAWTDALVEASAGADLFICECMFETNAVGAHIDYATLDAERHRFTCRRLVLTHLGPQMLARATDLAVETAYDGLEIAL